MSYKLLYCLLLIGSVHVHALENKYFMIKLVIRHFVLLFIAISFPYFIAYVSINNKLLSNRL